jgi:hypothetical protein
MELELPMTASVSNFIHFFCYRKGVKGITVRGVELRARWHCSMKLTIPGWPVLL